MKYFALLFSGLILLAGAGCNSGDCIKGSRNQISQVRTVDAFSTIKVGGAVKLIVKQAPQLELRIIADDNIQDEIKISVRNNQLEIDIHDNFCDEGPITVYATSPNLEGIEASGAVEVLGEGEINSQSFNLDLSGASKVMLNINCGTMNTQTSGSSKVMLKGQAGSHDLKMSGSSELEAFGFVVGKYNINTSGASDLKINVLNELNVESSGSSKISYRGNPQHITNDNSGASTLKQVK